MIARRGLGDAGDLVTFGLQGVGRRRGEPSARRAIPDLDLNWRRGRGAGGRSGPVERRAKDRIKEVLNLSAIRQELAAVLVHVDEHIVSNTGVCNVFWWNREREVE